MKLAGVWAGLLALGLVSSSALAALGDWTAPAAPEQGASCGGPGLPACPLQAWMRSNVAAPLAANNAGALAASLERTARLSPEPGWSSWAAIAAQGAAAAKKGDITAARASCKGCHDAWRE